MVHKLLGHVWLFVKTKHANRAWLIELAKKTFVKLKEFILSLKVAGVEAKKGDAIIDRPTFALTMPFEFELRKVKRVRAGLCTIDEGIKAMIKDAELKELHFLTPFRFQGTAQSTGSGSNISQGQVQMRMPEQPFPREKGKGKKGKGKCKEGGKAKRGKTPDGSPICYSYNNPDRTCGGN